ncbi:MAG: hypothetical protein QM723_34150 [Myxococcaceae bacterium]
MAGADDALDRLRSELNHWFQQLPEPPLYRRRDDPVVAQAKVRVDEGLKLKAQLDRVQDPRRGPLASALEAHLSALELIAGGKIEAAEQAWSSALQLEREAMAARRLWHRSDEQRPPVFSRQSGSSRYDPQPETTVDAQLACPNHSCHQTNKFGFSSRHAHHRFLCPSCKQPFRVYFAEVRALEVKRFSRTRRQYFFRLEELEGAVTRLELVDTSDGELKVARRDLLAFLYTDARELRGVLDLSSARVLWVRPPGLCFIATATFGEDAPELDAFRRFRDRVLMPRGWGRAAIESYYWCGPPVSRWLSRKPWRRRMMRSVLSRVHQRLEERGF